MLFVFRMTESAVFQESIEIFLPQPGSVEQNTIDLIFLLSIFNGLVSKDLQADFLQCGIGRIIRVSHGAEILSNDFAPLTYIIALGCCNDL